METISMLAIFYLGCADTEICPYFSSLPLGNFPGVSFKIPEYDLPCRKKYSIGLIISPKALSVGKHDKQSGPARKLTW